MRSYDGSPAASSRANPTDPRASESPRANTPLTITTPTPSTTRCCDRPSKDGWMDGFPQPAVPTGR